MKKLVLITVEKSAEEVYSENLRYFFNNYVNFESYSISPQQLLTHSYVRMGPYGTQVKSKIAGDLIVISHMSATEQIKPLISETSNIIYIESTFLRSRIEQLKKIRKGTKVLVVDYNNFCVINTISVLLEMGINELEFIPFSPESKKTKISDIKIAVTPGLVDLVPDFISEVIDLGWRKIDISTITNIATRLNISGHDFEEKVFSYTKEIFPRSIGLTSTLKSLAKSENEIETILEAIDEGIIVLNTENRIIHCNDYACDLLQTEESLISNKKINEIINLTDNGQGIIENKVFSINNGNVNFILSKRPIFVQKEVEGYLLTIKNEEKIHEIENRIRRQLVANGHIAKYTFDDILFKSDVMRDCITKAKRIAKIDATTLITGDTGTGKELFASSIHNYSIRKVNPFVAINCAALPPSLLESELFGYEEGSFTGAKKGGKRGLFEVAHKGTLFLDEIGDISESTQVKLLRVLQERVIMRVGGTDIIPVDVRVIAATNKNLEELVSKGSFRKDFYYRLNVFSLYLPPLRARKSDIEIFIKEIIDSNNMKGKVFSKELLNFLNEYEWNGNIRELKNCIEYLIYMGGNTIEISDLPSYIFKNTNIPSKSESNLSELFDEEKEIAKNILEIIRYRNSIGRRKIKLIMEEQGYQISEYRIRIILKYLKDKSLIKYGEGRSGISLM